MTELRKDLVQKTGKAREHLLGDVPVDDLERVGDRAHPERFGSAYVEAYVEGCVETHFHFRAGTVNGGILGDWCAAVKCVEQVFDLVDIDVVRNEEREGGDVDEACRVGQSVLVLDRKLVELPQGVGLEPVPSLVRLQPLDLCLREWGDAPRSAIEFGQRLGVLGDVFGQNREARVALDLTSQTPFPAGKRQLEGEVVEGGSEVVDAVSGDKAEPSGGGLTISAQRTFFPVSVSSSIQVRCGFSSSQAARSASKLSKW
jgi:hypothetical protein